MTYKNSLQNVLNANIEEHKNEIKGISKSSLLSVNKPIKIDNTPKWNTSRGEPVKINYKSPKTDRNVEEDKFSDRMFQYVLGSEMGMDKQNTRQSNKGNVILKSLDANCEIKNFTDVPLSSRGSSGEMNRSSGAVRSPEKFHFSSPRYPSRDKQQEGDRSAEEAATSRELLPHYLQPRFKTQYSELMRFRAENVREKDEREREILTGPNLVRHLENRLKSKLDKIKELGLAPNFRRLQIYAETFGELISESWLFGSLLGQIKGAYDAEVERVLEMPVSQKELMESEIEQLRKSIYHKEKLENIQSEVLQLKEAIKIETEAEKTYKALVEDEEKKLQDAVEAKSKIDEEKRKAFKPQLVSNIPTEAEKLDLLKVQCWDIMDEISQLQKQTKQHMTSRATVVHLSAGLQDIGMEVEKLNFHRSQLDSELSSMKEEFDQLLQDSDISEDNYRLIYSLLTEPSLSSSLNYEESHKWNWYIS